MMKLLTALLVLCAINACFGQSTSPGGCPKIDVPKNFDITQVLGTWYPIKVTTKSTDRPWIGSTCASLEWNRLQNGTFTMVTKATARGPFRGSVVTTETGTLDKSKANVINVVSSGGRGTDPWYIVKTDYKSYALLFTCTDYLRVFKIQSATILSRQTTMDVEIQRDLENELEKIGFSTEGLEVMYQGLYC